MGFLSFIFRDCILFSLQIRENIRQYIKLSKTTNKCMGCNIFVLNLLRLKRILFNFASNYRVFGKALFAYKPFGNITKVLPDEVRTDPFKIILKKYWYLFQVGSKNELSFSYKKSWRVYNASERVMLFAVIACVAIYILQPVSYFIFVKLLNSEQNVGILIVEIIQFIFGTILNIITGHSIAVYTEVFFYRLYKYHFYMKCMAECITLRFDEDKSGNFLKRQKTKLTAKNLDEFNKETSDGGTCSQNEIFFDVDGISMADPVDYADDNDHMITELDTSKLETNDKKSVTKNGMYMTNIFLFIDDNYIVWFENWCRMEFLARAYFENTTTYVFGIIFCLFIGFVIVFYNTFVENDWFDANVISASCGMLFFFVVFLRLLLVSTRFSSLEKKHIALLQIQHSLIINENLYRGQDEKGNEKIQNRIYLLRESLSDMINHIKFVSLSPKIAGVSLNDALVRLFTSAIIGGVSSAAAAYWKSIKGD